MNFMTHTQPLLLNCFTTLCSLLFRANAMLKIGQQVSPYLMASNHWTISTPVASCCFGGSESFGFSVTTSELSCSDQAAAASMELTAVGSLESEFVSSWDVTSVLLLSLLGSSSRGPVCNRLLNGRLFALFFNQYLVLVKKPVLSTG